MSYASIMVYVEADRAPEKRVQLAASLANRFNAALTGMSALAILPPLVIDGRVLDEIDGIDVELMKSEARGCRHMVPRHSTQRSAGVAFRARPSGRRASP